MKSSAGRLWVTAAILGAMPAPLLAQDASGLVGTWSGTIEEGDDYYEAWVAIDLDRQGRPVGSVGYGQPCTGVWADAARQGRGWRFEETITEGRGMCVAHVTVTLTETDEGLEVRLRPVGSDGEATGTLYRGDAGALVDAAANAEAAADALDAAALDAPAWCNPGETGIEFGQAAGEPWFVDSDPIRVNGRRFAKYGLPRVLAAAELATYSIYADASVFVEAGSDAYEPEVIYVLVGPPAAQGEAGECEYQPYQAQ